MSSTPGQLGSLKTGATRTQLDLPNVFWTFTTPLVTIIGLFSNVGEDEAEIHPDQVAWFQGELKAADPNLPLIVTIHHPPFSGDNEHSGSSVADQVLTAGFKATGRYPNLVLSGHVHNYQRFTSVVQGPKGQLQIPYIVAGAGGYTNLGKMQLVNGALPKSASRGGERLGPSSNTTRATSDFCVWKSARPRLLALTSRRHTHPALHRLPKRRTVLQSI